MPSYRVLVKEEKDEVVQGVAGATERKISYVNRTDLGLRVEGDVPRDASEAAKAALLKLPGMRDLVLRSVTIGPKNTINIVVSLPRGEVKKARGWTWVKPPSSPE